PRLANVHKEQLFAAIQPLLRFRRSNLEIGHRFVRNSANARQLHATSCARLNRSGHYFPLKFGLRFSINARMPSQQSSDRKHSICSWTSCSKNLASFVFELPNNDFLTARIALVGPCAIFCASAFVSLSSCSTGTTRLTMPRRSAVCASIISPV